MEYRIAPGDFLVMLDCQDNSVVRPIYGPTAGNRELCQVVTTPGAIDITTDSGGLYAVFGDQEAGIFSSSLRAVLLAGKGRQYPINRDALCEQLVTGATTGRETCFDGIERLDGCGMFKIRDTQVTFRHLDPIAVDPPVKFKNMEACIDFELEVLRARFREIAVSAGGRGVSMGLSGGYDSRLMLLLSLEAGIPVNPFTFTSASHQQDHSIALALAQSTGLNLRRIAVRPMGDLDEADMQNNIDDAIAYYDGRTNDTMGTFADVHTARIHRLCIGNAALNLNGLGGEMYRNRQRLPPYAFPFRDWVSHYVIGTTGRGAFLSDRACVRFVNRLSQKYGALLNLGNPECFNRHTAQCWYRKIWLPYFAGPRLSAENRVGPSLMPYADGFVSAAALAATPFIGPHGGFEAAVIRRIDRKIAALPSSYGPGFGSSPLHRRLHDLITAAVPLQARLARHRIQAAYQHAEPDNSAKYQKRFVKPLDFLKSMKLPLNLYLLLQNQVLRDRTLYIAEFLYRHHDQIAVDK